MPDVELALLQINLHEDPKLLPGEFDAFDFLEHLAGPEGSRHEELATEAMRRLNSLLDRVDYSHCKEQGLAKPRIITKLGLPLNIGGYFQPGTDYVVVNPIALLYRSEAEVFRIIQHETNHYAGIMDESTTDLLALLQMQEAGYSTDVSPGYHELVQLLSENLQSGITAGELIDLITDDDLDTLCNFIDAIFITKIVEKKGYIDFAEIRELIQNNWKLIQELFPRLLNSLFMPMKGVHDHANNTHLDEETWGMIEDKYLTQCLKKELRGDGRTLAKES